MEFRFESRRLGTEPDASTTGESVRPRSIEAGDMDAAIAQYANLTEAEVTSMTTPQAGKETIVTTRRGGAFHLVRVSQS
jgi:hypothetical protein